MSIELTNKRHHRIRDFVLYIAISLTIIAVIAALLVHGADWDKVSKWLMFLFFTGVVFGYCISQCRSLWNRALFWMFLSCSLLLHSAIIWAIFTRVDHPKPVWMGIGVLELALLLSVAKWLIPSTPSPR
jgi:predicted ferric reductase